MLAKLFPPLLAVAGLAAGAGAGLYLRPGEPAADSAVAADGTAPAAAPSDHGAAKDAGESAGHGDAAGEGEGTPAHEYVKLSNQFVVPVVEGGRVAALVILSLSLEVKTGTTEAVYQIEPKLRDGFLQVMFDHANSGGFKGTFTDGSNMVMLRQALREVAQRIMGPDVSDVLIVDLVRQDN